MPNKHYLDPHIDEQIISYQVITPMITLELVKKAAFGFGFDIEEHTEHNYYSISGSLFTLKINNTDNKITLNSLSTKDIGDEELMEELAEIRVVRDELNELLKG